MTITLTREEAQQLIDELWKSFNEESTKPNLLSAIETIRAKLSEPEPEPVAWLGISETWGLPKMVVSEYKKDGYKPVYLAPPQREWQGLTVDEFYDLDDVGRKMILEYGRLVEAKLREKNNG
jgi:hypothetical protein